MPPKLSRSQIKLIKEELKKSLENEDFEEENSDTIDISAVKKMYSYELDDEGVMHSDQRVINRRIKRNMMSEARREIKVAVKWNLEPGDAVQFRKGGNIEYGMIVKQSADGNYRNASAAKNHGKVLVMCSSGNIWMNPRKLEKIED
jgi:hypothetical protein